MKLPYDLSGFLLTGRDVKPTLGRQMGPKTMSEEHTFLLFPRTSAATVAKTSTLNQAVRSRHTKTSVVCSPQAPHAQA